MVSCEWFITTKTNKKNRSSRPDRIGVKLKVLSHIISFEKQKIQRADYFGNVFFSIVSMNASHFPVKPGKTPESLYLALTCSSFLQLVNNTARRSHESGNLLLQ